MGNPAIQLRSLSRIFQGQPPVAALADVNITIERGEYIAIEGTSGSGKSTLFNMIALLDRPTTGSYYLNGRDTAALSDAERAAIRGSEIGLIFQDFHLLSYRSALENVSLGGLYLGISLKERVNAALEALHWVGLGHRIDARPSTMSGGERQRVAIARAVAYGPGIMLCDEPTGALDTGNTASVLDLLDELHDRGSTILVITHDRAVSDRSLRTLTMSDGRLEG